MILDEEQLQFLTTELDDERQVRANIRRLLAGMEPAKSSDLVDVPIALAVNTARSFDDLDRKLSHMIVQLITARTNVRAMNPKPLAQKLLSRVLEPVFG